MAVRHVQHERPEGDPPRGFGERGQHGHGLGHARVRVRFGLGIPKVIPRPHPVEAGLLDGERRARMSAQRALIGMRRMSVFNSSARA